MEPTISGTWRLAGIVADLFWDWLQFYKEAAIQFHSANRSGEGLSRCAWTTSPAAQSAPERNTPRPGTPGRGAGPSERRYGPARMGRR